MIYAMQPIGGGPIKIGHSCDVVRRHKQLEAHYRTELVILATMDGDEEREAEIHQRFAHLRFGRTEQFRPAPELMEFLERPLLVGANPDAVEAMEPYRNESLRKHAISFRCSESFAGWLEGLEAHTRIPRAVLFELAVVKWAKEVAGYATEAPKR